MCVPTIIETYKIIENECYYAFVNFREDLFLLVVRAELENSLDDAATVQINRQLEYPSDDDLQEVLVFCLRELFDQLLDHINFLIFTNRAENVFRLKILLVLKV